MLDDLISIHREVIGHTPDLTHRYLFKQINWDAKSICVFGDRGVGKTTLLCQALITRYKSVENALYFSADNIHVASLGMFSIAKEYFALGGKALFIDEVHKYPSWSIELKNIIDTYKDKQVVFSGSSAIDLKSSKGDLSRRVMYHELRGLSFREYLQLVLDLQTPSYPLSEIISNHVEIAESFKSIPIRQYFYDYLRSGYYPFFLEGVSDYLSKLNNVIEKVIYEDIAVIENLRQPTLPMMKRLLWLIATTPGLIPNIDRISKNLQVSRELVYLYLEYLHRAGLITNLHLDARGMKLARKPAKILMSNTNLIYAINGSLKLDTEPGAVRESFFVNQLSPLHRINLHDTADFVIDGDLIIEVGGKSKTGDQLREEPNGYLALDGIDIGIGKRIPLFLFGLLY